MSAVPIYQVVAILDRTTVLVAGGGIEAVSVGSDLLVLAVGAVIPGANVPLVVPKARLEVTQNAGKYVIARPPEIETESTWTALMAAARSTTVRQRPPLSVDEKTMLGNPGAVAVKVGDPVIRETQFREYALSLQPAVAPAQE